MMRKIPTDRELVEQWKSCYGDLLIQFEQAKSEIEKSKKTLRAERKHLTQALQSKTEELKQSRAKLKKYKAYVLVLTGRDSLPKTMGD